MDINDPQVYEFLKEKFADKSWRLSHLYFIKDKNGKKIRFVPNAVQMTYATTRHNRNIILKARQQGFTTFACIDALDDVLFNPYFDAGIIADTKDNAEKIFTNKVKFAYDELPEIIRNARPANTDRAGELRFNNNSSISVSTSFRGGTLRRLHVSEMGKIAAKYPMKAREIITGAFEAVPLDGQIDVESTAEGMEGEFYEMCEIATAFQNKGSTHTQLDFKMHFYPWYGSSEYRIDPENVEVPHKLQDYFKYLETQQKITLDDNQRAWYVKKEAQQKGDMKREYPSYPEEAFMSAGRPVFDVEQVAANIKRAKEEVFKIGDIINGVFTEDARGAYKLFTKPKKDRRYAIGADVAEGIEGGDFSTMTALNKDLEQVMSYHGHLHPDKFGSEMIKAGRMFSNALLAPEVNNHGLTTLTHITNANYPFLYMRQVLDERTNDYTPKAGWQTNVKTKTLMLDEFVAAYRDGLVKVNDVELLQEMIKLSYNTDGSVNLNGKDRVVSICVALQATKQVSEVNLAAYDTTGNKKSYNTMKEYLQHSEDNDESYFE